MEKYRRVPREKEPIGSNEIRITSSGKVLNYVVYAGKLLTEQNMKQLVIKATGNAIARAITLVEILKRRFKGLHQLTKCGSTTITDVYEPTEEGLDKVTEDRVVSFLEATLSFDPLDETDPGYQAPLDEEEVAELKQDAIRMPGGYRGRGGYRGGYRGVNAGGAGMNGVPGIAGGFSGRGGFRPGFRRRGGGLNDASESVQDRPGNFENGGQTQENNGVGGQVPVGGAAFRGRGRGRGYRVGIRGGMRAERDRTE